MFRTRERQPRNREFMLAVIGAERSATNREVLHFLIGKVANRFRAGVDPARSL
jgi:hypothetical protein